jgi:hypothetical protein
MDASHMESSVANLIQGIKKKIDLSDIIGFVEFSSSVEKHFNDLDPRSIFTGKVQSSISVLLFNKM